MRKSYIICIIFLTLLKASIAEANQQLARFALETDKGLYELGEEITVSGLTQNLSSQVIYIQTLRPLANIDLFIAGPNGRKFQLKDERGPFIPTDYSAVMPSEKKKFFTIKLGAKDLNRENTAGLEFFSESGKYEISYSYRDSNPVMEKALKGTYNAKPVTIEIASLKNISKAKNVDEPVNTDSKETVPVKDIRLTKEQAILIAQNHINSLKEYKKIAMSFLFISDTVENGCWAAGFEEEKTNIFHLIKVNAATGRAEEAYFLE
ncbi:MAG: hypothetical protein COV72_00390 [Candidatus Omnitrophica bacterium CG11_big_fil_rev_8_21_14_0_20_42_13]|uniref:Uncharacterized protein n=1 Tax=Candidatus Ghiorseimicrobium undicola TaxID=1974746 RepID=A0A2H0M259_9BACT|nr:MAG: hypothetical protein COV72_00390 [Candidatus Omnitrophica bacterium CG11_big_fil_rev_8_21_14_0_20_42_13]